MWTCYIFYWLAFTFLDEVDLQEWLVETAENRKKPVREILIKYKKKQKKNDENEHIINIIWKKNI